MILPDFKLTRWANKGGLTPFDASCINPASVDLKLGREIIILERKNERLKVDFINLIPGAAILATTVEYVRMPINCAGVLYLKSSLARQGLDHALAGFVDPGFHGQLTMELHSHRPLLLQAGQRIVQLVLYRLEDSPTEPYAGRYQGQRGPTEAR